MTLAKGTVVANDFRIEEPLAQGGMGAVFIATQLSTGRRRALKVMLPMLQLDEASRARFLEEARASSRIDSEHVVEVVGAGIDPATQSPWLAMELLEGETLDDRVHATDGLSKEALAPLVLGLRHALGRAHELGIVHRDLKPENLFLAKSRRANDAETVKVLDFGIAKLLEGGRTAATQNVAGSPMWMAPEQADAREIRAATDVWALGLIAFYALTGRLYWRTASAPESTLTRLLVEVLTEPIDPASTRARELGGETCAAKLPAGFDAFFAKAVERDATRRYRNAGEALDALYGVLTGAVPASASASSSNAAFAATALSLPPDASVFVAQASTTRPGVGAVSPQPTEATPASGRSTKAIAAVVGLGVLGLVGAIALSMRSANEPTPTAAPEAVVAHTPSETPSVAVPSVAVPSVAVPTNPPSAPGSGNPPASAAPAEPPPRAPSSVPAAPRAIEPRPAHAAAPVATSPTAAPAPTSAPVPAAPAPEPPTDSDRAEARRFAATIIAACHRDNPADPPVVEDVVVTLGFGAADRVASVRIDGTSNIALRRCIVTRGSEYRVAAPPMSTALVVRSHLAP